MNLSDIDSILMALNSVKVSGLDDCAKMAASLSFLQQLSMEIKNENIIYLKDEPGDEK